jgi:hypothetical protein
MTSNVVISEVNVHKSHLDNYFSPPDLYDDFTELDINCCGTVSPNQKGMPDDLRSNTLNLEQEDVRNRRSGAMTAVIKDKCNVHVLTNIHDPPEDGNFHDDSRKALKPDIAQDYNRHMGYINRSERMANTYSNSRRTWKLSKKLFSSLSRPHNSKQPHSPGHAVLNFHTETSD